MSIRRATDEALGTVAREQPALARTLATNLEGFSIVVELPGESFTITGTDGALRTSLGARPEASVRAHTTRGALRDVLDGSTSLDEALRTERIDLFGGPRELAYLEDQLALFVSAAVRSPGMALLWERFVDEPDERQDR